MKELDKPASRDKIYAQIRRQHGVEYGVWQVVGIAKRTYYRYKAEHPDFAEQIETIRKDTRGIVIPSEDHELQAIAIKTLRDYITGGCKTKRLRRIMDAVPILDDAGDPVRNARGELTYDFIVKQVIEDIYDNGINLKAYEKVVPEDTLTEKALKLVLASIVQDIHEQVDSDETKLVLFGYLRGFKERAFLELAAITST